MNMLLIIFAFVAIAILIWLIYNIFIGITELQLKKHHTLDDLDNDPNILFSLFIYAIVLISSVYIVYYLETFHPNFGLFLPSVLLTSSLTTIRFLIKKKVEDFEYPIEI